MDERWKATIDCCESIYEFQDAAMTIPSTRLHISPLNPVLLDSILAPSIRPLATDVSFHHIATFPENDYGFLTLPTMEAEKLKKKLNGSILKGKKFKVDVARVDPKSKKTNDEHAPLTPTAKPSKRKADESVLDGVELPADRHIKRGWTEPASARRSKKQKKADKEVQKSKSQAKSKYTEKAECLFKTKLPPNKTTEFGAKAPKPKKSQLPNEVVVHEFAQTVTHPSFLKSSGSGKPVTTKFEEGKGWIDEEGNVQEEMSNQKTRIAKHQPGKRDDVKEKAIKSRIYKEKNLQRSKSSSPDKKSSSDEDQESDWTSSSGSSESDSESDSEGEPESESDESASSDGSSLATPVKLIVENQKATVEALAQGEAGSESIDSADEEHRNSDGGQNSRLTAKGSPAAEFSEKPSEVHPLEALFKPTVTKQETAASTNATFSFFTSSNDESEDENEQIAPLSLEPLTPYSRQDRQFRGLRSGAPTPDTAVFNKQKFFMGESEDEDADTGADDDSRDHIINEETPSKPRLDASAQQPSEESEFVKWFWENRGDNNRAWKRRRREAAKEKRQRENRRKGLKGRG